MGLNNKFLSIIEKDGNCVNYEKEVGELGHVSTFQDYFEKNKIKYSALAYEDMGMTLAQLNLISILNAKSFHLIFLPEQLTIEQVNVLETNRSYFEKLGHTIRTEVYCNEKTDYSERYRKLHKENMINNTNLSDVDQLYGEIERQKENLNSLKK